MQPVIYFGVRAWLSVLQWCERSERAFINNPIVMVAAGTVHSWAVVYSLFVAVHARAMRVDGYHEGYVEHLPGSVAWSEYLVTVCCWIWLLAGMATAGVRIWDDGPALNDTKVDFLMQIARSPTFRTILHAAHSISCAGLFLSLLSLCASVAFMKGSITICEICLILVSVGFAVPHAVMAIRRLNDGLDKMFAGLLPVDMVEAAVSEAGAYGPQLCILLGLADCPGHAYLWQNLVYVAASATFLLSLTACARSPPKSINVAIAPQMDEIAPNFILDCLAIIVILYSYPELNDWFLWLSLLLLVGAIAATVVQNKDFREIYMDWLEEIFLIQSDSHKFFPDAARQSAQRGARGMALLCALVAVADVCFRPGVQHAGQMYAPPDWSMMMMLKWRPSSGNADSHEILKMAADTLGAGVDQFLMQEVFPDHQLMIFTYNATEDASKSRILQSHWKSALSAPKGQLASMVDSAFPAALDFELCQRLQGASSIASKQLADDAATRAAYGAACEWMNAKWENATAALIQMHMMMNQAMEAKGAGTEAQPTAGVTEESEKVEELA